MRKPGRSRELKFRIKSTMIVVVVEPQQSSHPLQYDELLLPTSSAGLFAPLFGSPKILLGLDDRHTTPPTDTPDPE